jgi:hypothetical protein
MAVVAESKPNGDDLNDVRHKVVELSGIKSGNI